MKRGFLGVTIILGMLFSGFIGYSLKGIHMENAVHKKERSSPAKPVVILPSNKKQLNNDLMIKNNIVYWIDGVPRTNTQTIIKNDEVFVSVKYIAEAMGIPFQYQKENNLIHLGLSMNERVVQEKMFIKDDVNFLKVGMTFEQTESILGNPVRIQKRFNECTSNNEMNAQYKDAEILFIYDVTDKKYHISDITVLTENIVTEKGISIGSSTSDIRKVYGNLVDYQGNESAKVTEGFSGNGMVRYGIKESLWFELKAGKVVRFGIKLPHC